jgi:hypothetical protein
MATTTNTWTGWRPSGVWTDRPPQLPKSLGACFQGDCLAPVTLGPLHPRSLGDWVWVKTPIKGSLDPQREGPYQVILTTPSALKVAGLKPWIHHTYAKPVEDPSPEWKSPANRDQLLKLTLTRGSANEAPDRPTDSTNSCNNNK